MTEDEQVYERLAKVTWLAAKMVLEQRGLSIDDTEAPERKLLLDHSAAIVGLILGPDAIMRMAMGVDLPSRN